MERYIRYKLVGFNNIKINGNCEFNLDTNLFKSILISDDVKHLTVELQDAITLAEYENEILVYLNHICLNLIMQTEATLNAPVRILELVKDGTIMNIHDHIKLQDSMEIIRSTSAPEFYKKVVNSPTAMSRHFLLYERIFKTLHNPNKVVQFLSLYEFLMELLSKGKKRIEQKNVTEYIKNNSSRYPFVSFKPTRRKGQTFTEDNFTHLRNEIGHCEDTNDLNMYKGLGCQITDNTLRHLIKVLNDVISELQPIDE